MSDIPVNVPVDTIKLRVEKTAVRRIPTEAFYYLVELRYLWITYNSITSVDTGSFYNLKVLHELRLDGNMISVFPWESLKEMPRLRTLDLHNNRLTNIPSEATPYLLNITYLDISSNKLTTLSSDLMDIWPPFNGVPITSNASQKVVLGKKKTRKCSVQIGFYRILGTTQDTFGVTCVYTFSHTKTIKKEYIIRDMMMLTCTVKLKGTLFPQTVRKTGGSL